VSSILGYVVAAGPEQGEYPSLDWSGALCSSVEEADRQYRTASSDVVLAVSTPPRVVGYRLAHRVGGPLEPMLMLRPEVEATVDDLLAAVGRQLRPDDVIIEMRVVPHPGAGA
jgi:hypothetical protein